MNRLLVLDRDYSRELIRKRRRLGQNRYDEVWDGVYFMPPLPNNEHQFFQTQLAVVLQLALGSVDQGTAYAGVNVSDREKGWQKNYHCPDVAVILPGCKAKKCGTHWFGGPDFAVEILSPKDRSGVLNDRPKRLSCGFDGPELEPEVEVERDHRATTQP